MDADGETMLDKECFLAMNRFSVQEGMEAAFEQRYFDGFRGFALLRRDGAKKPGDGALPADRVTHST